MSRFTAKCEALSAFVDRAIDKAFVLFAVAFWLAVAAALVTLLAWGALSLIGAANPVVVLLVVCVVLLLIIAGKP